MAENISRLENKAYETAFISILLKSSVGKIIEIASKVNSDDLYSVVNIGIYDIIKELVNSNREVNAINIIAEAKKYKRLYNIIGGDSKAIENIESLSQADCNEDEIGFYINEIKKLSIARKLVEKADKLKQRVLNSIDDMDINQIMSEPQKLYADIVQSTTVEGNHFGDNIDHFIDMNPNDIGKLIGIPSRYACINRFTLGYQLGCVYTYSGYTNEGKSLLLLNEADYIGNDLKIPSLYIDTEMLLQNQQQPRLLSIRSKVSPTVIKLGLHLKDYSKLQSVQKAVNEVKGGNLYFISLDEFDEDILGQVIQYYIVKHGIQVVFFDYIKLPTVDRSNGLNETQQIGNLTNFIKNVIAKKYNLVVITACQTDEHQRNRVADSARIKRFSDFLANWRQKEFEEQSELIGSYELEIQKNRDEVKGAVINFKFDGSSCAILEADNSHIEQDFSKDIVSKPPSDT